MQKLIALVGRPNVGKSTLFNRLSINKKAIIHDQPGVTRDRKYTNARLGDFEFNIIDTPGLEQAKAGMIQGRMLEQTMQAIEEADLIALVVDGREGVNPEDEYFAKIIKKTGKNHIVIVNKCESKFDFDRNFYKLGAEPIPLSAEHGTGLTNLYDGLVKFLGDEEQIEPEKINSREIIKIAIVGRPNAGKSTFINKILGEERLLTSPIAGTTRDSIDINFTFEAQKFSLIDTAGLRRKSQITDSLEKLSAGDTLHNINFAQIVILMVDATCPLEHQDLNIANYAIEQGRALLIVVNKWDLIKDSKVFLETFDRKLEKNLSQVKDVTVLFISALNAKDLDNVFTSCLTLYQLWNSKIATNKLNTWIREATENHSLPLQSSGRRVKLKYITQTNIRPPTFKLFTNSIDGVDESYKRYLTNSMRSYFGLPGIPIRLLITKSENPYDKSDKK